LVNLLEATSFRLDYIWPSWSVFEAVSGAIRQSNPVPSSGAAVMREVERALESCPDAFGDTLDFCGAIYFHAAKPEAPRPGPKERHLSG
jgi:hypothetical protein